MLSLAHAEVGGHGDGLYNRAVARIPGLTTARRTSRR